MSEPAYKIIERRRQRALLIVIGVALATLGGVFLWYGRYFGGVLLLVAALGAYREWRRPSVKPDVRATLS